jgi:hypothetical protein
MRSYLNSTPRSGGREIPSTDLDWLHLALKRLYAEQLR